MFGPPRALFRANRAEEGAGGRRMEDWLLLRRAAVRRTLRGGTAPRCRAVAIGKSGRRHAGRQDLRFGRAIEMEDGRCRISDRRGQTQPRQSFPAAWQFGC